MTNEQINAAVSSIEAARGITHEEPTEAVKQWMEYHGITQIRPDFSGKSLEGNDPPSRNNGRFAGKEI